MVNCVIPEFEKLTLPLLKLHFANIPSNVSMTCGTRLPSVSDRAQWYLGKVGFTRGISTIFPWFDITPLSKRI